MIRFCVTDLHAELDLDERVPMFEEAFYKDIFVPANMTIKTKFLCRAQQKRQIRHQTKRK